MKEIFQIGSLIISVVLFALQPVEAQELKWAKQAGGSDSTDTGESIAVNNLGDSHVTGQFEGSSTFGAGEANETTLNGSGSFDMYIAKYNNGGNLLWARHAGGSRGDDGRGIAVDVLGNSYVTGIFTGSATFGAGEANETTLNSPGGFDDRDIYVAKYSGSGDLLWAEQAGASTAESIAVTSAGDSYVTGSFGASATFGAGEANETTLTGGGSFIAKYSSSGDLLWAKKVGESAFGIAAFGIAVDGSGDSYVTGTFGGSVTFGAGEANETTLDSFGETDIYVAKYASGGNLLWVKRAGSSASEQEEWGNEIAVDGSGNSYVTGFFHESATFGAGEANETTLNSFGETDTFVAKYNNGGNLLWARHAGGSGGDDGRGIAVDVSGSSYVTGYFSGSATFGAGEANEANLNSSGGWDIFIAKYNSSGNLLWATQAGGSDDSETGQSIAVDASGDSYVTGYFDSESVTFGLGEDNESTLKSSGESFPGTRDIFVASYRGTVALRPITIDIKPGNRKNVINPRAKGGIWVAILSDTDSDFPFDPSSQVDIPKVEFGPDGAKANRHKVKDINKDGLGDLLLRFKIPETGIACGDTEATLTGETFGGVRFTGTDSVKTVGCKPKKCHKKNHHHEKHHWMNHGKQHDDDCDDDEKHHGKHKEKEHHERHYNKHHDDNRDDGHKKR